ncbi:hypothetical protein HYW59_01780 [Candidatus Kaiserbacteria bacterium]|nr:hypothetical protein [Candidatus Kaiserbacteria bacterium]
MKSNIVVSIGLGFAILALVVLGFFVVRPVLAQVVASSTELLLGTTTPADTADSAPVSTTEQATADPAISPEPTVLGAATSTPEESVVTTSSATATTSPADTASTTETTSPAVATSTAEPPAESVHVTTESSPSVQTEASTTPSVSADELVEVKLQCLMSYTAPLYDTTSGHMEEGYFLGEAVASTTGMIAAQEIGEQSWTKCYDAQGKEYEFTLTPEEYDSFKIRGTPQKSVMLPAEEAAAASFSAE